MKITSTKKRNNLTVTVAVSAYNEEKNIRNLLTSVLEQDTDTFILEKILVISDGSTDKTVERVRRLNNKHIKLVAFKERLGKSSRLNYIYEQSDSDIIIQLDSDVVIGNKNAFRDIVECFKTNKSVMMIGGNPLPVTGKTFTEKAVNLSTKVYQRLRYSVREGNNIFSADGRILSYRKKLYKKIRVPVDAIANDRYTYFVCRSLNMQYRFVPSAVVYYRSPATIRDHIKQNTRFIAANHRMKRYFSDSLLERETSIPKSVLVKELLKEFASSPLACLWIYAVNKYCTFKANLMVNEISAKWDISGSTKVSLR